MKVRKNKLQVLDKATKIYRNPDDFDFGTFAVEKLMELGEYTILLLSGVDSKTKKRGKVLEYVVKTDNRIKRNGENSLNDEIPS